MGRLVPRHSAVRAGSFVDRGKSLYADAIEVGRYWDFGAATFRF